MKTLNGWMWGLVLVAFVVATIVVAGRMVQLRLRRALRLRIAGAIVG